MKSNVLFANKFIPKSLLVYSVLLFALIFSLSISSIVNNKEIGLAEGGSEYFMLGWNLHHTGKFFPNDDNIPFVFRPPGYCFFIAAVLKMAGIPKADDNLDKVKSDFSIIYKSFSAIYFAQCLLLGFSSVFLFLILSNFLSKGVSFILSFLFGSNPHLLILTGFIRYDILHVFLTIISCYVLIISIHTLKKNTYLMITAGLLWGLTTIVRPMTLILPPFILVVILLSHKNQFKLSLRAIILFTIGMTCIIGPYTIRNYHLTKRFIPINAQASIVFWASTATKLPPISDYRRWDIIFRKYAQPVWEKITKSSKYNYYLFMKHNLELNDTHKKLAFENLRKQPSVYLYNVLQHFLYFNFGYTSNYIELFLNKNCYGEKAEIKRIRNVVSSSFLKTAFKYYMNILTLFGLLGMLVSIKTTSYFKAKVDKQFDSEELNGSNASSFLVPVFIYLCFCVAHSISYMDYMYYYIKLPFLFIFFGYFVSTKNKSLSKSPKLLRNIPVSYVLTGIMFVFGLGLTISIMFC